MPGRRRHNVDANGCAHVHCGGSRHPNACPCAFTYSDAHSDSCANASSKPAAYANVCSQPNACLCAFTYSDANASPKPDACTYFRVF